jgi:hypothetical protein
MAGKHDEKPVPTQPQDDAVVPDWNAPDTLTDEEMWTRYILWYPWLW